MTPGQTLRAAVDADPRSISEIARLADLSRPQLYNLFRGDAVPTITTVNRLAAVLGLHPAQLMPPGISPLQRKALDAAEPGGYESVRRLTLLIQEILSTLE